MAEEQTEEQGKEKAKSGSKVLRFLVPTLGTILVAATIALLVWQFVLKPRIAEEVAPPDTTDRDVIPMEARTVSFENAHTTVVMSSPDYPSSTLLYKVALVCNNEATATIIDDENNKPRFVDMLRKVHSYKTREELDDPMIEDNLQRQITQRSNQILERLQVEPDPLVRVIETLHLTFYIQDL